MLADLGGQEALALETSTVHPRNFLGLELNPRAAAIAELVLWLGYLQWQMRNGGQVSDPVLERLSNITAMDAVLKHDPARQREDGTLDEYPNPRRPDWPQADYIVGNPPFIGAKWFRERLGDRYATALWKAHPKINKSADFVMYWWDRAAERLTEKGTRLKRFGFVTTNSITQEFNRRVMAARTEARTPVSLVMAIPDHPWTKATRDAAAVRIAMSVVEAGQQEGHLFAVIQENNLNTDTPFILTDNSRGAINADLTVGVNITKARSLLANEWLCSPGMKLHGSGFIVSPAEAAHLGLGKREGLDQHIRPYKNGRDVLGVSRGAMVIDLFGLTEADVRRRYPEVYQHLMITVKPDRDTNNRSTYRENWWIFGEPRPELRSALRGIERYVATPVTSKHRIFAFFPIGIIPDDALMTIAVDEAWIEGTLMGHVASVWIATAGSTLEDRPRFIKSQCFDRFPFPDTTAEQRVVIGNLAEEIDATRKRVLEEHADLTLTGLYNLREKMVQHGPLTAAEQDQRRRGLVDIITELHDRLDVAVANAYGWPSDLNNEDVIARLLALNAERHGEERAGKVRWLRPNYQLPRAGVTALAPQIQPDQFEALLPTAPPKKPAFPRDAIGQTASVLADLRSGAGLTSTEIARRYSQGMRAEPRIAATLAALGRLGHVATEGDRYTLRRAA